MLRIYIAGKYNDTDIVKCLSNIRKGIDMAAMLTMRGFSTFCPFLDFQMALTSHGASLTKEQFQANSMAWVEVSDALLVLPKWETSGGAKREIERAEALGIPVFYDVEGLVEWNTNRS